MNAQPNRTQPTQAAVDTSAALNTFANRIAKRLANWRTALIAVVALAQAGVLIFMVADREALLSSGQKIDLHVRPVDPRDLFRGDYVTLGYDISTIPRSFISGDLGRSEKIYVRLVRDGDEWKPVAASRTLQQADARTLQSADGVTLAAYVQYAAKGQTTAPNTTFRVRYGIEKFFVPEGTGRAIEKEVRTKSVIAHVAVGEDGTAALSGLSVAGTRYEMPPLF